MEPREIDNRYPEFAEPYEPVRGGKHHSGLKFTGQFLALTGLLFMLNSLFLMPVTGGEPTVPGEPTTAVVTPTPKPTPDPPQPTPDPPVPIPDPPVPIPDPPVPIPDPPVPIPDPPVPIPDPPVPIPDPPVPIPDPPVAYTNPSFTAAGMSHDYEPSSSAEYRDQFHYSFTIDLKDADTAKPLTVRLQSADKNGSGWQDVTASGATVSSLSYSGSGSTWEGEMLYDVDPLEVAEDAGIVQQIRIVFDYTLKDGTGGTLDSTGIRELYAYKGNYLDAQSAVLKGNQLAAEFKADTDLVMDTDKLTVRDLTLRSGSESWNLTDKATISKPASDGTITVAYELDGIEIDPSLDRNLSMTLSYSDKDGAIDDWQSQDECSVRIAPTVELDPHVYGPNPEGSPYPVLTFTMTLNDLKGGSASAKVYADTGNGFEEIAPPYASWGIPDYDPSVTTGDIWEEEAECFIEPPLNGGIAGPAKIVFDIVYPDGTTDTIETDTRPVHRGTFAKCNENYEGKGWKIAERTDPASGSTQYTMTLDMIIDNDLVNAAEVETKDDGSSMSVFYQDESGDYDWIWYNDPEIEYQAAADGTHHMFFTFVSDAPFPNGDYGFSPDPVYHEDEVNEWDPEVYLQFIKSNDSSIYEPEFTDIDQSHPAPQEDEDNFIYHFAIDLKDADTTKPIILKLKHYDDSAWDWVTDDEYTMTYSGSGGIWEGDIVYDMYSVDMGTAEGMLREMGLDLEYTLANGDENTLSSDIYYNYQRFGTLWSYKGSYLSPESAELNSGVLTAKFRVNTDLLLNLEPENLKVTELKLNSGSRSWDISSTAEVSEVDENGILTVTYTLNGEELDPSAENKVTMAVDYMEALGRIDWPDKEEVSFTVSATEPEVSLDHIWYWGEFNVPAGDPAGLERVEVAYTVTANDAADITSDVTLTSVLMPESSVSLNGVAGSGPLAANFSTNSVISFNSADTWEPKITLHYTLNGTAKDKTVTFTAQRPDRVFRPTLETTAGLSSTVLRVELDNDDRYEYDIAINRAIIRWYQKEGEYSYYYVGENEIWNRGSSDSPAVLSGPTGETAGEGITYYEYTLNYENINISELRPEDANCMTVEFEAAAFAEDPLDHQIYEWKGGLVSWGDFTDLGD